MINWLIGAVGGTILAVIAFAVACFVIQWVGRAVFKADDTGAMRMPREAKESPHLSRRTFLVRGCEALLGAAATCLLEAAYVSRVEPHWTEVTGVDVPLPGLLEALEGFAVPQLSDFCLGVHVSGEDVGRSLEIASDLRPDLILLTGDFVCASARDSAACAQQLTSLEPRHAACAVLGNHGI